MNNTGNALYLGRSLYSPALVGIKGSNHMLTIAGSQSGKTSTVSIPNALLWEGSLVVNDPKGSHAATTADYRERVLKQDVYIIDPFGRIKDRETHSFDPLEMIRRDPNALDIRERIGTIAEAMVIRNPGAHADSHWDDTSSSVTGGFIGHAVTSPDYQNAPLTIIRDFLTMLPDQQADLWASMAFNEAAGRVAKDAAARIIRAGDSNEMKSIFSSVEKHTDFLASEAIRRLFTPGKKTFPFARLKGTKPCTVYLVIPPERLDSQRRLIRLFLNLVISEMTTGGRARVPCLMLVDELLPLGFSAEILKAMSLLAGYNLIIWSFIQGLGALRDLYANSAEMFVANSRAVQVFNVSDEITTKYVSNYMGPRSLKYVRGAARITGQAPMLRTPAEVAREIGDGLQLVLRAGKPPLLLRKVPYYDSGPWKADARIPHFMAKWWNPFHGCFTPDPDFA